MLHGLGKVACLLTFLLFSCSAMKRKLRIVLCHIDKKSVSNSHVAVLKSVGIVIIWQLILSLENFILGAYLSVPNVHHQHLAQ